MINQECDIPQRSVYESARFEAWKHKWIESEKACHDQGSVALHEWTRRYWIKFLRHCLFEHMNGQTYYAEFGPVYFRLMDLIPRHDPCCFDFVIKQFTHERWDNLCFVTKSDEYGFTFDRLRPVLEKLPVNETRLPPPSWEDN